MRYRRSANLLLLGALAASGSCASSQPQPAVSSDAIARWRDSGDYDALREIVLTRLDPARNHQESKADVVKYLGEGIQDPNGYPNAGPNLWVYASSRPVPTGSYLYVEFGEDGFVKQVSWGSE